MMVKDTLFQVSWLKIKWMRYMKEEKSAILFKYDMDAPFQKLVVSKDTRLSDSASFAPPPTLYNSPPGLSGLKKKDLLTLCQNGSIPHIYMDFYRSLKVAD